MYFSLCLEVKVTKEMREELEREVIYLYFLHVTHTETGGGKNIHFVRFWLRGDNSGVL